MRMMCARWTRLARCARHAPGSRAAGDCAAGGGDESQTVLTATENGFGKRTPIAEYTRHGRGTQGIIAIQTSERNGKVVAATLVSTEDEIMLIGTNGVLIRTRVSEIREMGRTTQGVTLINLGKGEKLASLSRIAEPEEQDAEAEKLLKAILTRLPNNSLESRKDGLMTIYNFSAGPQYCRTRCCCRRVKRCWTGTAVVCR